MKVVTSEPVLECTFDEFWSKYWSKNRLGLGETQDDAETVLSGKSNINPKFRIPAADSGVDIFFDNREMLCRFANFPKPAQENFLLSIRRAMDEQKVNQIIITIPWSKSTQRRLRVRRPGESYFNLDFEMLR